MNQSLQSKDWSLRCGQAHWLVLFGSRSLLSTSPSCPGSCHSSLKLACGAEANTLSGCKKTDFSSSHYRASCQAEFMWKESWRTAGESRSNVGNSAIWGVTLKPAVTAVLSDWKETAETQTVHVSSEEASSSAVVPVCSSSGRTGMLERGCYLSESPFFMLGCSYS